MEKKCKLCKETKPLSEFYLTGNGSHGVRPRCKECTSKVERERYGSNAEFRWYKISKQAERLRNDPAHKAKHMLACRRWHLNKHYGMTLDRFDEILESQGGGCAICGKKPIKGDQGSRMVVDHCHDKKVIRGILCDLCNTALGKFHDDVEILGNAIKYLQSRKLTQ